MLGWIVKLFKKKPKKELYKKSEFTQYRFHKGERQYYCQTTDEWLYWYLLTDLVRDDYGRVISMEYTDNRKDLNFKNEGYTEQEIMEYAARYFSTEIYKSNMEIIRGESGERNSGSDTSGSSNSDYDSWYSSSNSDSSGGSSD